jgi:hypothetical protein
LVKLQFLFPLNGAELLFSRSPTLASPPLSDLISFLGSKQISHTTNLAIDLDVLISLSIRVTS